MSGFSITITGFNTKEQAIQWLEQYEGGIEQHFEFENNEDEDEDDNEECDDLSFDACCDMAHYIKEMKDYKETETKTNFNLKLRGQV